MTHHILSTAWLVVFVLLGAPSYAAEPAFMVWRVTESRTYEREELVAVTPSIGMPPLPSKVTMSRVTVALEGKRITGEWRSDTSRFRARAEDFPLGTDVEAATKGNRLLLKHPDGSVVDARIVRSVKPEEDDRD